MNYRVQWEVEVEAASPREAAQQALTMQQDRDSICHCYWVIKPDGGDAPTNWTFVDLDEE